MGVGGAVLDSLGTMGTRAIGRIARKPISSVRWVWRVPNAGASVTQPQIGVGRASRAETDF